MSLLDIPMPAFTGTRRVAMPLGPDEYDEVADREAVRADRTFRERVRRQGVERTAFGRAKMDAENARRRAKRAARKAA